MNLSQVTDFTDDVFDFVKRNRWLQFALVFVAGFVTGAILL